MTKVKTQNVVMVVMALLLIIAIGYIANIKYQQSKQQELASAYNQGIQDAVVKIASQAVTCQTVPLQIGNNTINLVTVACVQKELAAQQESAVQKTTEQ